MRFTGWRKLRLRLRLRTRGRARRRSVAPAFVIAIVLAGSVLPGGAGAQDESEPAFDLPRSESDASATGRRPSPVAGGWSLNIDNDLFTGGTRDRDYTGGMALTVSGTRARDWPISVDGARGGLTRLLRFDRWYRAVPHATLHSMEFGFALFTPTDISVREPIVGDHPYASVFFVANAAQQVLPERLLSFQSVLTLGVLGLPLAESVQSGIHRAIDTRLPRGWDNQISAGGEPTARLTLSVQKTVLEGGGPGTSLQLVTTGETNLGFTSDVSVGIGGRWGRLAQPWYTFSPHPAEYISLGSPGAARTDVSAARELYLYAGATLKYRLYNAVLQGQFRDSVLTYDREELEPVIAEGWGGVVVELGRGFRLGFFVRGRTAELNKTQARNPVWGGLILSRS